VDGDDNRTGHPLEEDELKRCPEFQKKVRAQESKDVKIITLDCFDECLCTPTSKGNGVNDSQE